MVVFLANRANLQSKRLHDRIKARLRSECTDVGRRRAERREPGPYRVVGAVDPRPYLGANEYPTATVRIEIGFQIRTNAAHEYYWINWIEPDRGMLVNWHQDDTHGDLGPVHRQVNDGSTPIAREPAQCIVSHPLDVIGRRLGVLPSALSAVEWDGGRPVELDPDASVIDD